MSKVISVLEYGKIQKTKLSDNAWEELCQLADDTNKKNRYLKFQNSTTLKAQNFVGIITTDDGTEIEILPKINDKTSEDEIKNSRKILLKMLIKTSKINLLKATEADLTILKNKPLHETIITWFLECIEAIIKKGLRYQYQNKIAIAPFLKGQLQIHKQLNQPPHKQHLFHIKYTIFNANRPENRLIHSALAKINKVTKNAKNAQLVRRLLPLFDRVDYSLNYPYDFEQWSNSRDMAHYQNALPLLQYILNQNVPYAIKDKHHGISFLLPMEKLFENYVAECLKEQLPKEYYLKAQIKRRHLVIAPDKKFQLQPDIAIFPTGEKQPIYILDTKWKLIDNVQINDNYKIPQTDVYQLFAYGRKYKVSAVGLIYPKWTKFNTIFNYQLDSDLFLDIMPFDLEKDLTKGVLQLIDRSNIRP